LFLGKRGAWQDCARHWTFASITVYLVCTIYPKVKRFLNLKTPLEPNANLCANISPSQVQIRLF